MEDMRGRCGIYIRVRTVGHVADVVFTYVVGHVADGGLNESYPNEMGTPFF